jgi:hypothetical protein
MLYVARSHHQEQRARHAQGTQGMPCEATLLPTFEIPALLYHMPSAPIWTAAEKKLQCP